MPMIDGLTKPQRKALDEIRASGETNAHKNTLDALGRCGLFEVVRSEHVLRFALTEAGEALYIENEMRRNQTSDFQVDELVEYLDWNRSGRTGFEPRWLPARVQKVGKQMLTLLFSDGAVEHRRATSVRKVQPVAKRERRDEWFETSTDVGHPIIRVTNAAVPNAVQLGIVYINGVRDVRLTPDEADQLAEMLRLAARGLRS